METLAPTDAGAARLSGPCASATAGGAKKRNGSPELDVVSGLLLSEASRETRVGLGTAGETHDSSAVVPEYTAVTLCAASRAREALPRGKW